MLGQKTNSSLLLYLCEDHNNLIQSNMSWIFMTFLILWKEWFISDDIMVLRWPKIKGCSQILFSRLVASDSVEQDISRGHLNKRPPTRPSPSSLFCFFTPILLSLIDDRDFCEVVLLQVKKKKNTILHIDSKENCLKQYLCTEMGNNYWVVTISRDCKFHVTSTEGIN